MRIIAGRWRGRKLAFPDAGGLRPSGDRVRETLFNWLTPVLPGSRCLDLFAGSGALGFEAASRGAARVVAVENDRAVVQALRDNRARLGADAVEIVARDALAYLQGPAEPFDIVFLDPPFALDCLAGVGRLLQAGGWLVEGARVYVETPAGRSPPPVPAAWRPLREKRAGQVSYQLFEAGAAAGD